MLRSGLMAETSDTPKVTVYVVNHNYGRFVEQAIDSVLNQTMTDFEILVIDDGSTDGSRELIERFIGHPQVNTIFQQNKGLTVTNNIALRLARGHYIMRLDADDYLDSNALLVLSGTLDQNSDVGMLFPDYYEVDTDGTVIRMVRRHDFNEVSLLDQPAHGACTMVRRDLLVELGGYDETLHCQDGYDLWLRFVGKHRVRNVNLPLFYYRQHGSNLTRNEVRLLSTRGEILRKHNERNGRQTTCLAIVPVRGHRVDPHSIALRQLGDRKVIDWTLDVALAAERVEGVIVTTPDDEVIAYVEEAYRGRVIALRRDVSLAMINSFFDETVAKALDQYTADNPEPDAITVLAIEAPFREPHHIDAAVDVLETFGTDRVVSVREETSQFYRHRGAGLEPLRADRTMWLEAEGLFRDAGVVQVARTEYFRRVGQFHGGRVGHVMVDQKCAHIIQSAWDWEVACWQADQINNVKSAS